MSSCILSFTCVHVIIQIYQVVRRLVEYSYLGRVSLQVIGDKILIQDGLLKPKPHLQAALLDSFLKLGESLQLCELKANSTANDLSAEHQQSKQTNNIDNGQEQIKFKEKQMNVLANTEQQKQTIKAESAMCESRVTTGLKEDICQFQENNKIPSVKNLTNTLSKTFNYHGKMDNKFKSSLTQASFKCDQCESKFQLENLLEIHKSSRHGNHPPSPPKKIRKRRSDSRPLPTR